MARVSKPLSRELLESLADRHGPDNWRAECPLESVVAAATTGAPMNAIVLAADIRSSTIVMREAINALRLADIVTEFVDAIGAALKKNRGWFDKFTGDGLLAYWIYNSNPPQGYFPELLYVSNLCLTFFRDIVVDELRGNTRNFPAEAGISLGIDAGQVNLVPVAGDLTIVGAPVVGAVRMATAATAKYETVVNGYLGSVLYQDRGYYKAEFQIERDVRATKEYPGGQEVYLLGFRKPLNFKRRQKPRARLLRGEQRRK
jgi:class 3 adenylate cyclase